MISLGVVFMVVSLLFLVAAGLNFNVHPRVNFGWWGMALWLASILFFGLR
jgi:hypothetical protein